MEEKHESFKQMPSDFDNFNVCTKDIAVYLTMCQYENWQTHTIHISVDTLSKKCLEIGKILEAKEIYIDSLVGNYRTNNEPSEINIA